ncbi:MAG: metalloregulator ArsR/SmtB family transcription factor [Cyclobacteriaceae bacterium]
MSRTLSDIAYSLQDQQLASFAKAMAHPLRIQILRLLNSQACCYTGALTEQIPLAQSTISQHLKALKDAGLIQGEIQPPKVKYCLDKENWAIAKKLFSEMID